MNNVLYCCAEAERSFFLVFISFIKMDPPNELLKSYTSDLVLLVLWYVQLSGYPFPSKIFYRFLLQLFSEYLQGQLTGYIFISWAHRNAGYGRENLYWVCLLKLPLTYSSIFSPSSSLPLGKMVPQRLLVLRNAL